MGVIQRQWTAKEADEWRIEDWIAIILSALAYIAIAAGIAMSLLLQTAGYIILGLGIVFTFLMYYVIDPKLKAISAEYEKKQKKYLDDLEKIQRWEEVK